jgi:hypothetical protein
MHSNARFRELSESDTAHLLETPMLFHRTASRVLSVVYATENDGRNTDFTPKSLRRSGGEGRNTLSRRGLDQVPDHRG